MGKIKIVGKINDEVFFAEAKYCDWAAIPDDNGKKRGDIIRYASKIEKNWLNLSKNEKLDIYIRSVDIALIEGRYYKINGVIRKKLWENGGLQLPEELIVRIYCLDQLSYEETVDVLYPVSVKNRSQTNVLECYESLGLSFNSDRLKHGYIIEALNIALRGEPRASQDKRTLRTEINIEQAISIFKEELALVDSINPNHKMFSTGVLAASLIMLSIDKNNIDFFLQFNTLQGEVKNGRNDPVEALLRMIEVLKNKPATSEGKIQVELCAKTIRAIQAWSYGPEQDKYWIKRLSSVVFLPEIRKMKSIKNIHGNREL